VKETNNTIMILTIFLFILGFVFLIKGASWLVEGASGIGRKLGIPPMVIGLTIVALGTSLPEMVISIMASIQGQTDLAISNVLGSNIINILLVLGLTAIIRPFNIERNTTWKEIPFSLMAAIVLVVLANDAYFSSQAKCINQLNRADGIIFLLFFIVFLYYSFSIIPKNKQKNKTGHKGDNSKHIIFIILGLAGLFFGGRWIVNGTSEVASLLHISNSDAGLFIVAFATSLPELATSAVAALKKEGSIAVGNVIGSNIFNIFLVLGLSAIITPLPFILSSIIDVGAVMLSTLLLFLFVFTGKGRKVSSFEGLLFLVFYFSFIMFKLVF